MNFLGYNNKKEVKMIGLDLIKKILILMLGLTSIGFGGSLFILSNIGSNPFNVFMQGLSNVGGLTVGQFHIIVSFISVIIIFFLDRQYIRIGTLLAVVTLGAIIDLSIYFLEPIFSLNLHYVVKFISMMTGSIFIAFGIAVAYCAKIGMVPNDALPVIISNKISLPFKWVRIGYDLTAVLLGVMMDGVFGVGTVFCVLVTGPLITFFIPHIEPLSNKAMSNI